MEDGRRGGRRTDPGLLPSPPDKVRGVSDQLHQVLSEGPSRRSRSVPESSQSLVSQSTTRPKALQPLQPQPPAKPLLVLDELHRTRKQRREHAPHRSPPPRARRAQMNTSFGCSAFIFFFPPSVPLNPKPPPRLEVLPPHRPASHEHPWQGARGAARPGGLVPNLRPPQRAPEPPGAAPAWPRAAGPVQLPGSAGLGSGPPPQLVATSRSRRRLPARCELPRTPPRAPREAARSPGAVTAPSSTGGARAEERRRREGGEKRPHRTHRPRGPARPGKGRPGRPPPAPRAA